LNNVHKLSIERRNSKYINFKLKKWEKRFYLVLLKNNYMASIVEESSETEIAGLLNVFVMGDCLYKGQIKNSCFNIDRRNFN